MAGLQGRDPAKGSAAEPFAELIRGRGDMDASEQIAFNNLQGEVAMSREMVRLLMEEIPSQSTAFEKIRSRRAPKSSINCCRPSRNKASAGC
jgi:hypothetical protein